MADFLAPSFSLGIDFGPSEPSAPPDHPPPPPSTDPRGGVGGNEKVDEGEIQWRSEDDNDEEDPKMSPLPKSLERCASPCPRGGVGGNERVSDEEELDWRPGGNDYDEETPEVAPLLKRLRRGPAQSRPLARSVAEGLPSPKRSDLYEDIEEFSSQEERDEFPSQPYRSVCGSSKLSLHGRRVLVTRSASKVKPIINSPCSDNLWSKDLASGNKKMLPKLTVSPLRKIQFIDSDSDDASPSTKQESDSCQRIKRCPPSQMLSNDKIKAKSSDYVNSSETLWKHFDTERTTESVATPAFDEFCKEYLSSMKDTNPIPVKECPSNSSTFQGCQRNSTFRGSDDFNLSAGKSQNSCHRGNLSDPQPPSHRYFFHDDMRIRKLLQARLPNFIPLGATGWQESEVESFDYMGQFGSKKAPAKPSAAGKNGPKTKPSSRKRSTAVADDPLPCENWVNPRSCMTYPKDAGRRRVHVESRSMGRWYTQGGRRVYTSKSGEELSGKAAYMCYRKESGGFRKDKKKVAAKKKSKK